MGTAGIGFHKDLNWSVTGRAVRENTRQGRSAGAEAAARGQVPSRAGHRAGQGHCRAAAGLREADHSSEPQTLPTTSSSGTRATGDRSCSQNPSWSSNQPALLAQEGNDQAKSQTRPQDSKS